MTGSDVAHPAKKAKLVIEAANLKAGFHIKLLRCPVTKARTGLATHEQGFIYVVVPDLAVGMEISGTEFARRRFGHPVAQCVRVPEAFVFADFRTSAGIRTGSSVKNKVEWGVQSSPDSRWATLRFATMRGISRFPLG